MRLFRKSKTQKIIFFVLFFSFFLGGIIWQSDLIHAQATASMVDQASDTCNWLCAPFKWLLYGTIYVLQLLASAALVLFETVISTDKISGTTGLLNNPTVYELWKFVRDFFNLMFILVLLFAAFATVFQIEQFSIKKIFLNILLAALLVNFSFPVTRFLIDVTNVPMYFFAANISPQGAIAPGGGSTVFGKILSASELTDIIVPPNVKARNVPFVDLILGVVFMFLFAISVTVLAIMMFIRLIALIILLIFSSVGFLFAAFPGVQKYTGQWWESFWKYALFGPAAMLMLLISVQFLAAVKSANTFDATVQQIGTNIASSGGEMTTMKAMVLFSLPIILIWFSIGLANSFSIAGAGAVTGWGKKIAKWGGSQAIRGGKWIAYRNPVARGTRAGLEQRFKDSKIGSSTEAVFKGIFGTGSAQKELKKLRDKEIYDQNKKNQEMGATRSDLMKQLDGKDPIKSAAAALSLAENGALKTAQALEKAIRAVGDNVDMVEKIMSKAKPEAFEEMTKENYAAILSSPAFAMKDRNGKPIVQNGKVVVDVQGNAFKDLNSKLKKEGQIKVKIDYEIDQLTPSLGRSAARAKVYDDNLKGMKADDLAGQSSLHQSTLGMDEDSRALRTYLEEKFARDPQYQVEMLKRMSMKDREVWMGESAKVNAQTGETVTPAGVIIPQGNNSKRTS